MRKNVCVSLSDEIWGRFQFPNSVKMWCKSIPISSFSFLLVCIHGSTYANMRYEWRYACFASATAPTQPEWKRWQMCPNIHTQFTNTGEGKLTDTDHIRKSGRWFTRLMTKMPKMRRSFTNRYILMLVKWVSKARANYVNCRSVSIASRFLCPTNKRSWTGNEMNCIGLLNTLASVIRIARNAHVDDRWPMCSRSDRMEMPSAREAILTYILDTTHLSSKSFRTLW